MTIAVDLGRKATKQTKYVQHIFSSMYKCNKNSSELLKLYCNMANPYCKMYYVYYAVKGTLLHIYEPRSDRTDLLATKVNSEIFTEKERPSYCEQLQKI